MTGVPKNVRIEKWKTAVHFLTWLLAVKIFVNILAQYEFYFPADFESGFLAGRESYFFGLYGTAFYIHIITGPVALVCCTLLVFSQKLRLSNLHRPLGKLFVAVVVLLLVPSGLVMATRPLAGPVSGLGLATLALATATSTIMAAVFAKRADFVRHRRWAIRCLLLLISPLLLRLMIGITIVLDLQSNLVYQFAAWASWLIPLAIHQCWNNIAISLQPTRPLIPDRAI